MPNLRFRSRHRRFQHVAAASMVIVLACGGGSGPAVESNAEAEESRAFDRGRNALDEGRWAWARRYFADEIERHPEHAEAWRLAAVAWSSGMEQSVGRALSYFEPYLEMVPDDDESRTRAIRWLVFSGEDDRARQLAADLQPTYEAHLLRANLELDADPQAALRAARAALEMGPDRAGAHAVVALVEERLGRVEVALDHARRAAALDPLDGRTHYQIGRLLRRSGDVEGARAALEAHQLIAELGGQGSLRSPTAVEALRLVRRLAERVEATAPSFRLRLLRALIDAGRHDEAREILAGLSPPTANRLELGALATELDQHERAETLYGEACADPATIDAAEKREACFRLAVLARHAGRREQALAVVDEALAREPWVARFHRLRASLLTDRGDEAGARAALEETLALAPWRAEDRLALAEMHWAAGRRREAAAVVAAAPEPAAILERFEQEHDLAR